MALGLIPWILHPLKSRATQPVDATHLLFISRFMCIQMYTDSRFLTNRPMAISPV